MTTITKYILFLLALGTASLQLNAATRYWTGERDQLWNEPRNWEPFGVPQDGEFLEFSVDSNTTMQNNIPNLEISGMLFENHDYVLHGHFLGFRGANSIVAARGSEDHSVRITCGFVVTNNVEFRVGRAGHSTLLLLEGPSLNINSNRTVTLTVSNESRIVVDTLIRGRHGTMRVSGVNNGGTIEFVNTNGVGPTNLNVFNGRLSVEGAETPSTIRFDRPNAPVVSGRLELLDGAVIDVLRPDQIGDSATVCVSGGSQLLLHGNTETIGSLCLTNFSTDTVPPSVDFGGSTLSVSADITAHNDSPLAIPKIVGQLGLPPGSHIINVSGTSPTGLDIQAQIIGGGGFTKTGPAGLLLSGNNTFEGDAVLQEGTTYLYHANALGGPSGAAILDGGTLSVVEVAVGAKTLWVNRPTSGFGNPPTQAVLSVLDASWAGPVVLNTNLFVHGGPMTFSGVISGPGGLHLFGFTNRLTGPEANTYTGVTTVDCHLLELDKPSGLTAFRGPLIVGNRGTIALREVRWLQDYQCVGADVTLHFDGLINLYGHREDFGPITFNGGEISTGIGSGFGELGLYGPVTVNPDTSTALISGRLGLPPGLHEFRVADGAAFPDLRIDATVLGAGNLRKTGPGQMWLAASNSYEGFTTVAEGALGVLDPHGLGASVAGTTVDDGATLELNFAGTAMPEPLALRGTGIAGNGALGVFGNVTLRNPFPSIFPAIDLTAATTIAVAGSGLLTVDGIISGIGPLTKAGSGTLIFANANANIYSGDMLVRQGALYLIKPDFAVAVPGDLVIGPAPFGSIAVVRFDQSGGMYPTATATVNAGSLLDLNGHAQTLSRLNLNDGGDAQTGPGQLSFPIGGIVAVGSLGRFGSHSSSYLSGNVGLPANATLNFAVGAYAPTAPFDFKPELEMFARIAAPGENPNLERAGISKNGPGTMLLTAGNSFNGRVEIFEGTLIAANNTALGSAFDGTFVFNAATLALQNGITVAGEILVLNSTASPALDSSAGDNLWNGLITLQRDSTVRVATGYELRVGGVIGGTGHFTKTGTGIVVFEGPDHNTFVGDTFVNEGPLYLAKPAGVTAVPQALSVGTPAGLFAAAVNYSSYQVIGNIFVNRGAVWNVYGHVENVDHLWLVEGGDVATETGILLLKPGGSIQVVPGAVTDPATIAGKLDMDAGSHVINVGSSTSPTTGPNLEITAVIMSTFGAVSLQKNGTGTLRLTANNTYSGSATINGGALQVDGSQPASSVSVLNGARLMGTGRVGHLAFGSFGGPGGVVAPGQSPGILSCANFNAGGVGGVLRIELNGTAPGSGHDQLYSRGPTSLVTLDGITLDASLNFASAVDDQFTIIRKDGVLPITGEFTGLPEGANFSIGGEQFTITYFGGTDNDVVLTRIPTPPKPVLLIQKISPGSVRLLWPASFTDYALQFTTNLSGANWLPASPLPAVTGANHIVTNATSDARKFYRLFKP